MNILFETPRLYVREYELDDADALTAFASHESITHWLPDWKDSHHWVPDWLGKVRTHYATDNPTKGFLAYAVMKKNSHEMVGQIGCGGSEEEGVGMCYFANPKFQGQGLMTEAMKGWTRYLFDRYGYDRLHATIQPDNLASIAVATKAGFRWVKEITMKDNGQTEELLFGFYVLQNRPQI